MINSPFPKSPQHAPPHKSNALGASNPHCGPSVSKAFPVTALTVLIDEKCSR